MADRAKAQKERADARQRRRSQEADQAPEGRDDGAVEREGEQPLEAVKQAAKVAVAGAAVGAAAAAARALTSRGEGEAEPEAKREESEAKPKPEKHERDESEPEAEKPDPRAQADQEPKPEQPPPPEPDREPEGRRPRPQVEDQRRGERHGATLGDTKTTVEQAREQLETILSRSIESVSGVERMRDGWLISLEVVELSRIPESTDVLATYELELDNDRNLVRYARVRRYYRSQPDQGGQG
jgi:hypothetical protein